MNIVALVGRLTSNIQPHIVPGQTHRVNFTLAVNDYHRDKVIFIDCVYFAKDLTKLVPFLVKGKQVSVEGRIDVYRTESGNRFNVIAHRLRLLGNAPDKTLSDIKPSDFISPDTPAVSKDNVPSQTDNSEHVVSEDDILSQAELLFKKDE